MQFLSAAMIAAYLNSPFTGPEIVLLAIVAGLVAWRF